MKSILITGGSGFIGSFIVEEALRQGYDTWVVVRSTTSLKYLQDSRIHLLELNMGDKERLQKQLAVALKGINYWDYVVHCAGLTKTVNKQQFDVVNHLHTVHLVETLDILNARPKRFILMSSLSIFGPLHEQDYHPIKLTDTPKPNTAYGRSKYEAEKFLTSIEGYPYIILRPTGVYGPRDKDYFLMAKSIKGHIDTAVGYKKQIITFVYVTDLVDALFLAINNEVFRRAYFLSDGGEYESATYSELIKKELGNPWMLRIKFPLFVLYLVSALLEGISKISKKPSTLNLDKYHIMKQRNWRCDLSAAREELGYIPKVSLAEGVKRCVAWYRENKWL